MYTVIENAMTGTVVINTIVSVIMKDTFEEAKQVLKKQLENKFSNEENSPCTILEDTDTEFKFIILQESPDLCMIGYLNCEPTTVVIEE